MKPVTKGLMRERGGERERERERVREREREGERESERERERERERGVKRGRGTSHFNHFNTPLMAVGMRMGTKAEDSVH